MSIAIKETLLEKATSPLQPPMEELSPAQRIHYMDNLRAMAMLLGVVLHAGLAYARPAQSVWLATDLKSSVAVDASVWFIHLFRMGLFFLLSGYFAKLVIERKGVKQFLYGRLLRVVAPFVLFYPFLLVAMTITIVFAISYLKEPKGLMGLIALAAATGDNKPAPPSTMHLWFLYYLMYFTVAGAILKNIKWLKPSVIFRNRALLLLSPLLLVPGAFDAGSPLPAPESFVPAWWPFAFYGAFYYAGWQLFGRELFLDRLRPFVWHVLALSIGLYLPYYWLMPILDLNALSQNVSVGAKLTEACFTAYLSVLLTLVSLLLAQRYLAGKSKMLSFIADSSYWIYLIHLPIVIFLQTLLAPVDAPLGLKLGIVIVGTLSSCLLTYVVFVRYTPMGWLLHGKRSFP